MLRLLVGRDWFCPGESMRFKEEDSRDESKR